MRRRRVVGTAAHSPFDTLRGQPASVDRALRGQSDLRGQSIQLRGQFASVDWATAGKRRLACMWSSASDNCSENLRGRPDRRGGGWQETIHVK
jgi:hypothetical protein